MGDACPLRLNLVHSLLSWASPGCTRKVYVASELVILPIHLRTAPVRGPKRAPSWVRLVRRLLRRADVILRQEPRTEPNRTKRSPAPRFHAVRKWIRQELYQTYTLFAQALPRGRRDAETGESQRSVPKGLLPTAFALRGIGAP